MKALVYLGSAKKALEDRPKPEITAPTDAIVKITKTTICGTDLHILKGDVRSCQPGRILGYEGVGIVDKIGSAVMGFKLGDRVWISGQVRRVTPTIKREMKRRAAVEPVIGHVKAEHRMDRNHLKGRDGDRANAVLAAAGYNFSLLIRWLAELWRALIQIIAIQAIVSRSLPPTPQTT